MQCVCIVCLCIVSFFVEGCASAVSLLRASCSSPAMALFQWFLTVVSVCCVSVVDKFSVVDKCVFVLTKSSMHCKYVLGDIG